MQRLPLSALVTSYNEGALLPRCLEAVAFCDELIVIDVESSDDTAAVARAHGAEVVEHPWVPIAEAARVDVADLARHDWLLVVDPDEIVPPALAAEVVRLMPTLESDVAAVDAPRQYYFGGRPLRGTVWGGANKRRLLVRRSAVELTPRIWGGMHIHHGYRVVDLPFTADTAIMHLWSTGFADLIRRHRRYLELEPIDRADAGEVTGYRAVFSMPLRSFRESFWVRSGYRDGLTGLGLSVFWAVFRTLGELRLLREIQRRGQPSL